RLACLEINAQHLLWVFVLSPADVSLLHRRWPAFINLDARVIHVKTVEDLADAHAIRVRADHADQAHVGLQSAEHCSNAARAAEAFFPLIGTEQYHGRFLADPLSVSPDVAVEHDVADDQDTRAAETLHEFNQFGGHGSSLGRQLSGYSSVEQGDQNLM